MGVPDGLLRRHTCGRVAPMGGRDLQGVSNMEENAMSNEKKITVEQAVEYIWNDGMWGCSKSDMMDTIRNVAQCEKCMNSGQVVSHGGGHPDPDAQVTNYYVPCDCELGKLRAEVEERGETIEFLQGFEQDTRELRAEVKRLARINQSMQSSGEELAGESGERFDRITELQAKVKRLTARKRRLCRKLGVVMMKVERLRALLCAEMESNKAASLRELEAAREVERLEAAVEHSDARREDVCRDRTSVV